MAEEVAAAIQKFNGDASEMNGIEENDDIRDVKGSAAGLHADNGQKAKAKESDASLDLAAPGADVDVEFSAANNAEGENEKPQPEKLSNDRRSSRGVKRRANSALSNKSEDDDLTAFEDTGDASTSKRLSEIIDKMEVQFRKSDVSKPTPSKIRRKDSSPSQQHTGTPLVDTLSRSSSGLSQRSEDHMGGLTSSNEVISSAADSPVLSRISRKSTVDLSNPLLRVPLEQGWKRELVYRSALDSHSKRTGDIYYYTPAGLKLRSSREVGEHLYGTGLTLDNFSFFKEPLGINDPEKEIIRDAKVQKSSPAMPSTPTWSPSPATTTPRQEGKRTPKPKVPKGASPDRSFHSPKTQSTPKVKQPKLQVQALLGTSKALDSIPKADTPAKGKAIKKAAAAVNSVAVKTPSSHDSSRKSGKSRDTPTRNSDRHKAKDKSESSKDANAPRGKAASSRSKSETPKAKKDTDDTKDDSSKSRPGTPKEATRADKPKPETAKPDAPKGKTDSAKRRPDAPKAQTNSPQPKPDNPRGKGAKMPKIANGREEDDIFTKFYNLSEKRGYKTVENIFQYLKMRELATAARVCTLWRRLVEHPSLWKHVRMKNSQVNSWKSLCAVLKRHGTTKLDLRKMLLPQSNSQHDEKFWKEFCENIVDVDTLERLELCRCPAWVVEEICRAALRLEVFNALSLQCERFDPSHLHRLTYLRELRLKSQSGFTLTSDLKPLSTLTRLKHLSLTSIKDLGSAQCESIGALKELESVELGECSLLPSDFGSVLAKLPLLTRLRFERGASVADADSGARLLRTLATIPTLSQLELVNFDVKPDFDDALAECTNLRRLLLIPTYVSQSATTNKQVLSGLLRLKDTLTHLMWGVTVELLRVTELFIDQCEQNAEKKNKINNQGDCIPVLKPVPGFNKMNCNEEGVHFDGTPSVPGPPQVEILPLPVLQKLLMQSLPNTKLKVLKTPFHATWRQSLADFY